MIGLILMSTLTIPTSVTPAIALTQAQKISLSVKNASQLKQHISFEEGVRFTVYQDKLKNPTIGIGFNLNRTDAKQQLRRIGADLDSVKKGATLSQQQVDRLYENTVVGAIRLAKKKVGNFDQLSAVRQNVIVDMAYQLGEEKFTGFTQMIKAIEVGKFDVASTEMMIGSRKKKEERSGPGPSRYAKQVPERAFRNSDRMLRGQ